MDINECSYSPYCINTKSCLRCVNQSLLKLAPKYKNMRPKAREKSFDQAIANKEDSWKDLEQSVADGLNNVPSIEQARRSRCSGGLWFEKGDVVDSILHPECKERTAEKSFSIKREWLEKAAKECELSEKTMCLPFRFKGDKNIYCVFQNNDIMNLITMMKSYMRDNDKLREENKNLKSKLLKIKLNKK